LNPPPGNVYRRFLLGMASEEEQIGVEEAVLSGRIDATNLQNAEDELIDDYLLGDISEGERRDFEQQFLVTDERRQRFRFASELIEYSRRADSDGISAIPIRTGRDGIWGMFPWKRAAFLAAAASILFAVVSGIEFARLRQQNQIAQSAQDELARLQRGLTAPRETMSQVQGPNADVMRDSAAGAIEIATNEIGPATRDFKPQRFRVPVGAQVARIYWELPSGLPKTIRLVLVPADGQRPWTEDFPSSVLSSGNRSTFDLPASVLIPGRYHLWAEGSSGGPFKPIANSVIEVER
jgi:hypothetical protein